MIRLFSNCGGTPLEKSCNQAYARGFFSVLGKEYVPSGDESLFYKGSVHYLKGTEDLLFFQCFGEISII